MELKPMFETATIKFATPIVQTRKLEQKVVADPSGSIPNGIYKVIHWEKVRQLFTLFISLAITIASIVLISLYATIFDSSWIAFVIPIAVLSIALYKTLMTWNERRYLLRSVVKYREDLKIGLTSTPPFISKLYIELHKKQITHNWVTFTLMFYGGICTLLLWWLKDTTWWIFNFDKWIHSLFSNPDLMSWLFTASLITIIAIHVVLSVQRKRRILEINSYFGSTLMPESELIVIKEAKNKSYRRIFVISLMITLLIPVIVKIVIRTIKRK